MLKHLPAINKTMKGMGVLMDNERPVVRFMSQHWPLTLITGYALYKRLNKRRKDKSLSAFTALTDSGMVMGPLAAVALISLAAGKNKKPVQVAPEVVALPAPAVSGFAGDTPPPAFFATRPPQETRATMPDPAEEVVTKAGPPPTTAKSSTFDSFLS